MHLQIEAQKHARAHPFRRQANMKCPIDPSFANEDRIQTIWVIRFRCEDQDRPTRHVAHFVNCIQETRKRCRKLILLLAMRVKKRVVVFQDNQARTPRVVDCNVQ